MTVEKHPAFDNVYFFPGVENVDPTLGIEHPDILTTESDALASGSIKSPTAPVPQLSPMRPFDQDNWRSAGSCQIATPDIFVDQDKDSVRAAKAICSICEVRVICLNDSLDKRAKGTRGGYSEKERRKILRERRRMSR